MLIIKVRVLVKVRFELGFILIFISGLASTYPEPHDKMKWLEEQLYNFNYESAMPITWSWPEEKSPFKTRELIPTKLQARNEDEK